MRPEPGAAATPPRLVPTWPMAGWASVTGLLVVAALASAAMGLATQPSDGPLAKVVYGGGLLMGSVLLAAAFVTLPLAWWRPSWPAAGFGVGVYLLVGAVVVWVTHVAPSATAYVVSALVWPLWGLCFGLDGAGIATCMFGH